MDQTLDVAVIVGSLRKDSINRKVAQAVVRLNAPGLTFRFIEIGDLPHYNFDFEDSPPPAVVKLRPFWIVKEPWGLILLKPAIALVVA